MRRLAACGLLGVLGLAAAWAESQYGWTQLSLSTCGVDEFLAAHPASDGRGVVIAILDTGVDPSIPGLTHTPDGQIKVVDVQDFTGEGDVELHRVRLDEAVGRLVDHDEDGAPVEYEPPVLGAAPVGRERRWWMGVFEEANFVNSDHADLNDNGQTDDEFAVLVTAFSGDGDDDAVCYVDTNTNRSFADERPLRNYRLNYDTFILHREKPERQIIPLTFAVNIFLREPKVVIHFDDGAHGTHVAGIAAGYRINGQADFHGVAPGAKLMSLKIGQNAIGGVSTTESMKQAFEYAARYAREHGVPVVCNMSYGVESEIEGQSDIDKFVDELLRKNPHLVFCTSAGNSGPGLSTVGTPAAAAEAITVAALMAADTARDVVGWSLKDAVVTVFSSRGGELDKPDLAAPGWSTSTVPRWVRGGDFWSGTSMASPYAAGLCALLISDALARDPQAKVRACDVRRALCLSCRPAPGGTPLDYGWGIPHLPRAAELLRELTARAQNDPIIGYNLSTPCGYGYGGRARAAYWRGVYFPGDERQVFTVNPVFAPTADAAVRTAFTRKFSLRSTASWCRVTQETCYLRSEQPARVYVEYDPQQLTEPGLYVGAIEACSDDLPAFRLLNTIIVPHRFSAADDFARVFPQRVVNGWTPDRYFLAIPPGASCMRLTLSAPEGQKSKASFDRVYDPRGTQFRDGGMRLDTEAGRREVSWTLSDELTPGVWEVDVHADRPDRQWPYELKVRFFGLHAEPAKITEGKVSKPAGDLTVTNLFERVLAASADGQIEGYRLYKDAKFEGLSDELRYSISLDERFDRLRLRLEMTPEDYATTTDIGVEVLDAEGEAIHQAAFDSRVYEGTVGVGGRKSVTVVIRAGFAVADDQRKTPITVKIDQLLADPVPVSVKQDEESELILAPGVPVKLKYSAAQKLTDVPEGLRPVGFLRFRERASNEEALRVPIDIGG